MKRSRTVDLVLLISAAAALEGCSQQQCVDERDIVVDNKFCQTSSSTPGIHGYRFYNGGPFGYMPMGSSVRNAGTIRGIFGGAGASASHGGGGEGGGE